MTIYASLADKLIVDMHAIEHRSRRLAAQVAPYAGQDKQRLTEIMDRLSDTCHDARDMARTVHAKPHHAVILLTAAQDQADIAMNLADEIIFLASRATYRMGQSR